MSIGGLKAPASETCSWGVPIMPKRLVMMNPVEPLTAGGLYITVISSNMDAWLFVEGNL